MQDYLLEKKEEKLPVMAEKAVEVATEAAKETVEEKASEEVAPPISEEDVEESKESLGPLDEDNTNSSESVDQEADETHEIKV